MDNPKAYKDLSKEYQVYQSFIINYLMSDNVKIIDKELIDTEDEMYIAWTTDENISMQEYENLEARLYPGTKMIEKRRYHIELKDGHIAELFHIQNASGSFICNTLVNKWSQVL